MGFMLISSLTFKLKCWFLLPFDLKLFWIVNSQRGGGQYLEQICVGLV